MVTDKKTVHGYKLIFGYLGLFILMIGTICLFPLIVIPFYQDEYVYANYFIFPGVISIFIGYLLLYFLKGKEKGRLLKHQDAVLVLLIWVLAILICSIPFLLYGKYNFTQSIFEVTSGFSTTGLSVVDVEKAPRIYLLYRSLLLFFGGVGLVLVLTSAISDRYGMRLYFAEGHSDKLMPNLMKSARLMLSIYLGYIIIGTLLYIIFGMPIFDAINHSIASVSTGGFSTKYASIGHYNNYAIEVVTIILMLLGNTNFIIHLYFLRGKLKNVINHCELKLIGILIIIFLPIMVFSIISTYNGDFYDSLRISLFQFFSGITTTGFQTVDSFNSLPTTFMSIMILLMLIGGGIGSTAGGIKQYRIVLIIKGIYWNVRNKMSHKRAINTNYITKAGKQVKVNNDELMDNSSFIFLYLIAFVTGTIIFNSFGYSLKDSMFEFASALGTVGLSIGITGYNAHPIILWTATIGMIIGRLEIYVVITAITKLLFDLSKKEVV